MDDFIRKKILYYLKFRYDKNPYDIVNLVGQLDIEVTVIERNVLYLAGKGLIRHFDQFGHEEVLAQITGDGITFVENDYKENHEENILEFMRERIGKKGGLTPDDFPEYLFRDRESLISRLLRYDRTEVASIHHSNRNMGIDFIVPKPGLIAQLEDLKKEKAMNQSFWNSKINMINIANIGRMESSQLQQGTENSNQHAEFKIDHAGDLMTFLQLLREKIPDLTLNEDNRTEIDADVKTIEIQLASRRPKKSIIRESLTSIRKILEGAGGGLVAAGLLKYIPLLLASIKG